MWVCLNNAFLSIVNKGGDGGDLLVRARRRGDIERVFPDAAVVEREGTDYEFRAHVSKAVVASAMVDLVQEIDYSNFKSSVTDTPLHDAYMDVWLAMNKLQEWLPYRSRLDYDPFAGILMDDDDRFETGDDMVYGPLGWTLPGFEDA